MTNKELLELAAKAAEIKGGVYMAETPNLGIAGIYVFDLFGFAVSYWNPLTDDGDALRLAVKLRLRNECSNSGQVYVWRGSELVWNEFALHEDSDFERCAATRRAITRAAAEIGKDMK